MRQAAAQQREREAQKSAADALLARAEALGRGRESNDYKGRIVNLNRAVGGDGCYVSDFTHVSVPSETTDAGLVEFADLLERHRQEIKAWEARHGVKPDDTEAA